MSGLCKNKQRYQYLEMIQSEESVRLYLEGHIRLNIDLRECKRITSISDYRYFEIQSNQSATSDIKNTLRRIAQHQQIGLDLWGEYCLKWTDIINVGTHIYFK